MIKKAIDKVKNDRIFRTYLLALFSIGLTFAYAIYNGAMGVIKLSIWNGSICLYYLLLLAIKIILASERKNIEDKKRTNKVVLFSFILLFVITLAMIPPAILMINNKRPYDLGLVYAITMAAYSTYSITMSFMHYNKDRKSENLIVRQIRLVNVVSALMSIIVLQNTMILANGGIGEGMKTLSTFSSALIIGLIILIISIQLIRFIKNNRAK